MCKAKQRKWKLYFIDFLLKEIAIGQTFSERAVLKWESLFKIESAGTGFSLSLFTLLIWTAYDMLPIPKGRGTSWACKEKTWY